MYLAVTDKEEIPMKNLSVLPRISMKDSYVWFLPLIILSLLLGFAAPAAAQMHGWRYGSKKSGLTQDSPEQKNTSQQKAYDNYKLKKEKMNLERQKNGLEPKPVATFEEWQKGVR
jgi:hypothetical protein